MHNWYSKLTLIAVLLIVGPASLQAANWACGQDLNMDGELNTAGETASCFSSPDGELCPISAVDCSSSNTMVCNSPVPMTFDVKAAKQTGTFILTFDLVAGTFSSAPGVTAEIPTIDFDSVCTNSNPVNFTGATVWNSPSLAGTNFPGATALNVLTAPNCGNGLQGSVQITDTYAGAMTTQTGGQFSFSTTSETCALETAYACPLGNTYSCMANSSGTQQCSPNACVDLDTSPPLADDIDTGVYSNDGNVAADGTCLSQVMIFAGRSMRCDKAGVSTAFQNCCKATDKILSDDTGDSGSPTQAITQLFDAVTQGKSEYEAALAIGAPTLVAGNAAAEKVSDVMGDYGALIDPMAMAGAVMDYFTQSCDQTSTETGMLNGSGFCYEVGEFCREEWALVGCVQKSKSYCCFNSKMGRIIHQQGRSQLSTISGFGTSENPNCRGLTPEEFQSIDFSKIDFSDYYGDLVPDTMTQIEGKVSDGITDFYDNNK